MMHFPSDPPKASEADRASADADLYCELDPRKLCDNCFQCLESQSDYATVEIDGIYLDGERLY